MYISYLNGSRLARALRYGARRLRENAAALDAINVFPVPDGDTGTNMAATVQAMAYGAVFPRDSGVSVLPAHTALRLAADSTLEGARGNSGAIFAQFMHGLAEELAEKMRVSAEDFAAAAKTAVDRTYQALSAPREGTILTVLREWSDALHRIDPGKSDFVPLLQQGLEAARTACARTRYELPEAAKAGVVDAGALGFVHFLEGISQFIREGRLRDTAVADQVPTAELPAEAHDLGTENPDRPLTGRYCTETLIRGTGLDLAAVRNLAGQAGDSVVVAGGGSTLRLHVHTDQPAALFRKLAALGVLDGQKVDDMRLQREFARRRRTVALVVDSTCDMPDAFMDEHFIDRVPVKVEFAAAGNLAAGSRLDKDALAGDEFLAVLADPHARLPTTSQPAHKDYVRKFSFLLAHADRVVYLGLSGGLSGTLEAGRRAAADVPGGERISVVDTRSASIATALILRRVAEAVAAGADADAATALAEDLRGQVGLLIALPSLRNLIRSGRISRLKGTALEGLGIRPVLTLDAAGKLAKTAVMLGGVRKDSFPGGEKTLLKNLIRKRGSVSGRDTDFAVGHVGNPAGAERLAQAIQDRFRPRRPVLVSAVSPALAVHIGLRGLGVAWLDNP